MPSNQMLEDELRRALGEAATTSPFEPTLGGRARARIRVQQSARILAAFIVFGAIGVGVVSGVRLADRPVIDPGGGDRSLVPSPAPSTSRYFDGTVHGWRIAEQEVLEREGLGRSLNLDCEPREAGRETPTNLDIDATYLPDLVRGATPSESKWVCDGHGLSALVQYEFEGPAGAGSLRLERSLYGARAFAIYALTGSSSVSECFVGDRPAICVRRDTGSSEILVIEDDVLDPHAIVLLIEGEGLPFDELMRIAEGIRPPR